MNKKDITEKMLENYNDIFADIINVILFHGEQIVDEGMIVLYFGNQRWNRNKSLRECMTVPMELAEYVNDYRIHVCEVAYLTEEQLAMFRSDFKVVAEFFVKRRLDKEYVPESREELKHIKEVLNLLSAVTNDNSYKQIYQNSKGKVKSMCEVADRLRQQGLQQGIQQGMQQGLRQGEHKLSSLMSALFAAGRTDDARIAVEDLERRQQLYHELGIIE